MPLLARLAAEIPPRDPAQIRSFDCGVGKAGEDLYLARIQARPRGCPENPWLRLVLSGEPVPLPILAHDIRAEDLAMASVWIGIGKSAGSLGGVSRTCPAGPLQPLEDALLVGCGMHRLGHPSLPVPPVEGPGVDWTGLLGGLCGGGASLRRLQSLRIAVVGANGPATLLVEAMACMGLAADLVDPASVTARHVGESPTLSAQDLHKGLAEAIADEINSRRGSGFVRPQAAHALHCQALLKAAEVIVSCLDEDEDARRQCGILANRHLAVWIDVQTHICHNRRMHEVRLLLPGEGCVECRGDSPNAFMPPSASRDGKPSGAKSLPLGMEAGGVALALLVDLVDERLSHGVLVRGESHRGLPALKIALPAARADCPECARIGLGDLVIPTELGAWRRLAQRQAPEASG